MCLFNDHQAQIQQNSEMSYTFKPEEGNIGPQWSHGNSDHGATSACQTLNCIFTAKKSKDDSSFRRKSHPARCEFCNLINQYSTRKKIAPSNFV